jgi:hypothetical protein
LAKDLAHGSVLGFDECDRAYRDYRNGSATRGSGITCTSPVNPIGNGGAVDNGVVGNTACGTQAQATGLNNSSPFGEESTANGPHSTAIGAQSDATSLDSTAVGYYANANSQGATAIGGGGGTGVGTAAANATGEFSIAVGGGGLDGEGAHTGADNAIAMGRSSDATGLNSMALGYDAQATQANSTAIGVGTQPTTTNQMVFGVGVGFDNGNVGGHAGRQLTW